MTCIDDQTMVLTNGNSLNLQHFSNPLPKQGHSCNCAIK